MAHGTRDPAVVRVVEAIARRVDLSERLAASGAVLEPQLGPSLVLAAFGRVAARVGLSEQAAGSGAILTLHLSRSPVRAAFERLRQAGRRPGGPVQRVGAAS